MTAAKGRFMLRWHTLATWFRRRYGVRVQKIPLDAGATCPNRDGSLSRDGCLFCNAGGSGSGLGLRGMSLAGQWRRWHAKYAATDPDRRFMAYLQSFSNTYGPVDRLRRLLEEIVALPGCMGVSIGTRPDCLDEKRIAMLAGISLPEVWLELGLQSAHDATLRRVQRGHDAAASARAIRMAAQAGLLVCGHLMAGLPGEDYEDFARSVDWAVSLPLAGLKLHNVYVPRGTGLARLHALGQYAPLARDEYVDWLCGVLPRIPSTIVLHRIQADPSHGELEAPTWALDKRGVITDIRRALAARQLWQGCRADAPNARPEWFGG